MIYYNLLRYEREAMEHWGRSKGKIVYLDRDLNGAQTYEFRRSHSSVFGPCLTPSERVRPGYHIKATYFYYNILLGFTRY